MFTLITLFSFGFIVRIDDGDEGEDGFEGC